MTVILAVVGGLGAVTRHLMTTALQRAWNRSWPSGTVIVNLVGSLIAGLVVGRLGSGSATALGFLAGFTTYSAWMVESVWLWQRGPGGHGRALLDVVGTLLAGVFLVWLGSSAGARL